MTEAPAPFFCRVDKGEELAVLRPEGELDLNAAPKLKQISADLVESGIRFMAIDLSTVSFMDSSGLGALVVLLKRTRDKGGNLCLFGANEQVRTLLSMTGLEVVLHQEADETAARKFLSPS